MRTLTRSSLILLFIASTFSTPLVAQYKITDFFEIIGLSNESTKDDVIKVLGEPTKKSSLDNLDFYYYDYKGKRIMSASIDANKGGKMGSIQFHSIVLFTGKDSGLFEFLETRNIKEPKLDLLMMESEKLTSMFGEPKSSDYDTYTYVAENIEIVFYCYKSYDYKCREFKIFWYN